MNFNINVDKQLLGKIVVTDTTNESGGYASESTVLNGTSTQDLKYSLTVSINTIMKMTTTEATLIDVVMNDHATVNGVVPKDNFEFVAEHDGYYILTHFVIPNITWVNQTYPLVWSKYYNSNPDKNGTIYYIDNSNKLMQFSACEVTSSANFNVSNLTDLSEASVKLLLEANLDLTPVKFYKLNLFYDGYLKECHTQKALELFNTYLKGCTPDCKPKEIDTFPRDFLHMTLHIIHYLIKFGLYMEALRILELIEYCGGFCKNLTNEHSGCGCHTKRTGCGCSNA